MRYAYAGVAALALLATLPLSGCVALLGAGAGAGAVTYVENGGVANYYAYYPVTVAQAAQASQSAFGQIGVHYEGMIQKTPSEVLIEGSDQRAQRVKVTITSMATQVSKVNIRVGTLGDKALSMAFQNALANQLGLQPLAQSSVPTQSVAPAPAAQEPQQQTIPMQ
ncbi:MAG: DUF3568 domain-containing protein [Acidithiobacillus sp.]|nr:DUF3568 domain-containing protein [Acidithiobacillus sp.]